MTDPASLSGALAANLRSVVTTLAGEGAVRAALARVPESVRHDFESITGVGWIPITSMEAVFAEIALQRGQTLAELHEQVARIAVEQTLRTVWRMLLRLTTDHALISRAPALFARSYNRGRVEASLSATGRGELTLHDWPNVPDWVLRGLRIGTETSLRLAGRSGVRAVSERRPNGALLHVTWR
ncbi:MAG TPA: hypothetical protein VI072_14705 [Polyangiaceae bacterium]